ncbi:hypothetical protein [Holdemanella biformis]|uniref:hypothetical protein n=1 Tax=Holdemanella biformis TaxID=1735 RepID=UPI002E75D7E9|nr:hypothetical protein [Holdemanella biformis]MEE0394811.1 hypothetical protein [Holdemanella biformis]
MSVQGLTCTFTLSNMDAYFLVEDEKVSYKSKVVASGMMYRIFGQNTDILVFVDTIPYIRNNAMSYDEVVRVELEGLDYDVLEILSYKASVAEELEELNIIKRTYLVDVPSMDSGVLRIEISSNVDVFDGLVQKILNELRIQSMDIWEEV